VKKNTKYQTDEYYSLKEKIADVEKRGDEKLESAQKLNDAKFKHIEEDTAKALASNDKRLDGMNEFRNTLKDQSAKFATKDELEPRLKQLEECRLTMMSKSDYEARHDTVLESLKRLEISKGIMDGKADQKTVDDRFREFKSSTNWTRVFLILTALLSAASVLITIFK
jgi:hypothetical protein